MESSLVRWWVEMFDKYPTLTLPVDYAAPLVTAGLIESVGPAFRVTEEWGRPRQTYRGKR